MKTFNIVKKNRKYFAAVLDNKYNCKILIDANSENLALGQHTLEVEDISVRSQYGTDLIYKLAAAAEEIKNAGICTLQIPFYNAILVDECHKLGGKWDAEEKAWIFSGIVSDKVEELDAKYNSTLIDVEITFNENAYGSKAPVFIAGFKIATATGRDSGAKLAENIALIAGKVVSCGSVKNWGTEIIEGSVIRMQIPADCIEDIEHDVTVKNLATGEILVGHVTADTETLIEAQVIENADAVLISTAVEKLGYDAVYELLDGHILGHQNKYQAEQTIKTGKFFDPEYKLIIENAVNQQAK